MKNKLKILYDASILTNSIMHNSCRSGIFFTAHNVLRELLKRDDIEIGLYVDREHLLLAQEYFEKYSLSNTNLITNTKFRKIALLERKIINTRTAYRGEHKPVRRFLLKIFLFLAIKPIARLSDFLCEKSIVNNISKYDIFFSPMNKIPIDIRSVKKYTILYDVIPILFPDYNKDFQSEDCWFNKMFNSLNERDNYFAISEYTRQDFLKYCPQIDENKITTTLLACGEDFKPQSEERVAAVRQKYNIHEGKKYIFSLCTLEPRKNLIRAVKTFIQFIKKNNIEDLVFVLGGGHWEDFIKKLEGEISNLGEYRDKIIKIGYVADEDLAPLYSGAEWFVYTSQYEGFGLPPLEAMSCGCPVITSNNSSLPEVVGNAGIMIDYDGDEQHIAAYEQYYFNENLRKENSAKGLCRAKEFSWEKCVNKMVETMKEGQI